MPYYTPTATTSNNDLFVTHGRWAVGGWLGAWHSKQTSHTHTLLLAGVQIPTHIHTHRRPAFIFVCHDFALLLRTEWSEEKVGRRKQQSGESGNGKAEETSGSTRHF